MLNDFLVWFRLVGPDKKSLVSFADFNYFWSGLVWIDLVAPIVIVQYWF